MQRTCVKCGHNNLQATGTNDEACPQCGAIYAKASASAARPAARASGFGGQAARASGFGGGRASVLEEPARPTDDHKAFVVEMRARSLYPTVRAFVNIGFYIGIFIAVMVVAGGAVGTLRTGGPLTLLIAMGVAAVIALVALAWREISLMLADLSDAAVRMAAGADRR